MKVKRVQYTNYQWPQVFKRILKRIRFESITQNRSPECMNAKKEVGGIKRKETISFEAPPVHSAALSIFVFMLTLSFTHSKLCCCFVCFVFSDEAAFSLYLLLCHFHVYFVSSLVVAVAHHIVQYTET